MRARAVRMTRLPVKKTYKLFIGGAFPRSRVGAHLRGPRGRTSPAPRARTCATPCVAARGAQPKWAAATAYNRGQVLYRVAEMMEARAAEFAELCSGTDEVERAIDRWVWYAGFADKLAQVLGSANPVAGPYFNFTIPEPTGVVAHPRARRTAARSGSSRGWRRRSLAATPSCARLRDASAARGRAGRGARHQRRARRRRQHPHRPRAELAPWLASHMDVNAIDLTGAEA